MTTAAEPSCGTGMCDVAPKPAAPFLTNAKAQASAHVRAGLFCDELDAEQCQWQQQELFFRAGYHARWAQVLQTAVVFGVQDYVDSASDLSNYAWR